MSHETRILVPVDFSSQSQGVVDHACRLAELYPAQLHIVHVLREPSPGSDERRLALEKMTELVRPANELQLETVYKSLTGLPHVAILSYAKQRNIDLIVMGTRGRRGLSRLALGSVAERVLRLAACPVQVVKGPRGQELSMERGMEVLVQAFGDELEGSRTESETAIVDTLVEALEISKTHARELLSELEGSEWVIWEPPGLRETNQGRWLFISGLEFLEPSGGRSRETDSPALDMLRRAYHLRATDIHMDPADQDRARVRLRIDGQLQPYCVLDHALAAPLINQLKTLAHLDIAEPFRPKEGRLQFPASAIDLRDVEARLTIAPVAGGEAVAVRLGSRSRLFIPIADLGFDEASMHAVETMLQRGEGLVLVTGPTGSGKTTTVYSLLETIGQNSKNMVSIEDPVEFAVPFVRQMEVSPRHGLTMIEGLKTLLRMDPDVVFLGETRDDASADIAMRAASSGRYVFSTLHTRDVAAVVTALRDLGLTDRSIAANLCGVINQRLVRKLCVHCRAPVVTPAAERTRFERLGLEAPGELWQSDGCGDCRHTGYHGRIGVFEAGALTGKVRDMISAGADEAKLREAWRASGLAPLEQNMLRLVASGVTDMDEATRVHTL